jgi:hypothetical protein
MGFVTAAALGAVFSQAPDRRDRLELQKMTILTTIRKATPSRNGGPLILNRPPPDDGLVEAEIAAFGGFWQYQFLDTGRPCTKAGDSRRVERRKCGFRCHPDAPLSCFATNARQSNALGYY